MTPWEFVAAVEGWKQANCPEEPFNPPTAEEHRDMMAKYG